MKNIIQTIFFEELEKTEALLNTKSLPEYKKSKVLGNAFYSALPQELKDLYNELEEAENALNAKESAIFYQCGFKTGFAFAFEVSGISPKK